jgi:hypothetical protein
VKLQFARHLGQFGGAGRIKDDLELHGGSLAGGAHFSMLNPQDDSRRNFEQENAESAEKRNSRNLRGLCALMFKIP